ncbi:flagellar motor switch protein FliG [Bryobacter aggregatus]|uniref:flagellar motor switch protein FliG n=1 Tax=Bryobacter aggregatus TaxID=360054 RepID=UPI0009B5D21E|nr:flagellar motor switch protein FliG [Bryobacter aggregatus]
MAETLTPAKIPDVLPDDPTVRVNLPGAKKAAILLIILGEDLTSEVLKQMDDAEVHRIGQELARATAVTAEVAEAILEEFYQMSIAHQYVLKGGVDYAKKVLVQAFGPEEAKKILDRLLKQLGGESLSFDALQKADPTQLAKFIHNEHPQTIALILSHLNPSQAAGLLYALPGPIRADVAHRMASLEQISPEIIGKIASIIGLKLKEIGDFSRESTGGVQAVAEMFNRLDSGTSKEILESLEDLNPQLTQTIRQLMFVFEDMLMVDELGIKELLSRIDRKLLTVALKGTSDKLRDHFLTAMSQRGAEMLREDMDALGPVKIREVEGAQQQIITTLRQLENEGVVNLKGTVGEQYVN